MNLRWSHNQNATSGPEIFAEGISPFMGKHCDLGHILDPKLRAAVGQTTPGTTIDKNTLVLDLEVAPNTNSHLLSPGNYRLELKIAAANSRPVVKLVEIRLSEKWFDDEKLMLTDGISIS
jgi:hypothetical protein